jgi:hypothetical protein
MLEVALGIGRACGYFESDPGGGKPNKQLGTIQTGGRTAASRSKTEINYSFTHILGATVGVKHPPHFDGRGTELSTTPFGRELAHAGSLVIVGNPSTLS